MICNFKSPLLIFSLLFLSILLPAQDSTANDERAKADSLQQLFNEQISQQVKLIERQFNKELTEVKNELDSVKSVSWSQEQEIKKLIDEKRRLEEKTGELTYAISENRKLFIDASDKLKRLILISGPSILGLVLISTILLFLLIFKYQEQMEFKINALRKYTYNEIEDTRNVLLKNIKKKVKKISAGLVKKKADKTKKQKSMNQKPNIKKKKKGSGKNVVESPEKNK